MEDKGGVVMAEVVTDSPAMTRDGDGLQEQMPVQDEPKSVAQQIAIRHQQNLGLEAASRPAPQGELPLRLTENKHIGFTPSGGSACQQSSRLIMVILFLLTFVLCALVAQYSFSIRDDFDARLEKLQRFDEVNQEATPEVAADVEDLLARYSDALANGTVSAENLCDAQFFANATSGAILVDTFTLLDKLVSAFAIAGAISVAVYLLTKCCVTVGLVFEVNQEENPVVGPGFNKTLVFIGGQPETIQQRRTRVYLRSETLAYMVVNALLDIPLVTFSAIYYMMTRSVRGTTCAGCFADRRVCEVGTLSDLDSNIKVGLLLVAVSLFWNAGLLLERWFEWVRYKRTIRGVYFNPQWYLTMLIVSLVLYTLIIGTPVALLYYYEIGPTYFDTTPTQLKAVQGFAWTGVGMWAVTVIAINLMAGIDPGEILSTPFLCCEVCETAFEGGGEACGLCGCC